jgi:hypothetical protein
LMVIDALLPSQRQGSKRARNLSVLTGRDRGEE